MKSLLKSFLRKFGYVLKKRNIRNEKFLSLEYFIEKLKCEVIIDVGANIGQFRKSLKENTNLSTKIISIEPIKESFDKLLKTKNINDICLNIALGEKTSSQEIHITSNEVSSSLFKPLEINNDKYNQDVKVIDKRKILVKRGDELIFERNLSKANLALKLDVQGYELKVIKGFSENIDNIKMIYLETSFISNYSQRSLFNDVKEYLYSKGFYIVSIFPGFFNKETNELIEIDVLFVKR